MVYLGPLQHCDFEEDLRKLTSKLKEKHYAHNAYHSLCNVEWIHKSAPNDWYDLLQQEALDLERKRNAFYRRLPILFIRWLRGYCIKLATVKTNKENPLVHSLSRQPWAWLNIKLMNMEWPFYVFGGPTHCWIYSCSWRYAGGLIADIRNQGEDYMDFYCSGQEGYVDDEFEMDMKELGWKPRVNEF